MWTPSQDGGESVALCFDVGSAVTCSTCPGWTARLVVKYSWGVACRRLATQPASMRLGPSAVQSCQLTKLWIADTSARGAQRCLRERSCDEARKRAQVVPRND